MRETGDAAEGRNGTTTGGGRRYGTMDGYRFLAASAIVVFHYNYDFHLGLSGMSRAFDKLYVYVDFFFVLSGFVIAESYAARIGTWKAYGSFLLRRLARVYPLHLATLALLVVAVEACAALGWMGTREGIFDRGAIPQAILLVHAWGTTADQAWNLPSWSISAEMFAYLLFPAMLSAAWRLPAFASVALAVAYVAAAQWARMRLGLYDLGNATSDGAMRVLPTFFLGIVVSRVAASGRAFPRVPWIAAHLAFALPLAMLHLGAPETVAVAVFPLVILLAALAERTGPARVLGGAAFVRLGHGSYALYMLHFPMALLVLRGFVRPEWLEGPARWPLCLATALASLALALACHRRFEVPAQRWILRRWDRPASTDAGRQAPSQLPDADASIRRA